MSAKKWVTIVTFFCTMFAVILLPIFGPVNLLNILQNVEKQWNSFG